MVGQISGVVFENDRFPPANPLTTPRLANIPVVLDGYRDGARRTDALGRFKFERVAPGKHRVSVLLNQVPAELALISNPEYYVDIGVGTSVEVNFALAKLGQLQGAMSIVPGSGVSEHDLSNVRFYLAGTDFDTYPEPDGEFRLTDVRPGTYILKSDVSAADTDLEVSPAELSVRIGSGQSISGLKFQLGYKARPVIKKEF